APRPRAPAPPPPPRAPPGWAAPRPPPPSPPLILLALLAALLIPGTGWLLAAFANVIVLFWLMTFAAGAVAFGRPQRRWHYHGGGQRPRHPAGRHYTWL